MSCKPSLSKSVFSSVHRATNVPAALVGGSGSSEETRVAIAKRAFQFDGTNDNVSIPQIASLNSGGAVTLWVKPGASGAQRLLFSTIDPNRLYLWLDATNKPAIGLGGSGVIFTAASAITVATHLALTWNATNYFFYINGVQVSTGSWTGSIAGAVNASIGSYNGASNYSNAAEWDIRVYSEQLGSSEIADVVAYRMPAKSLERHYKLDDGYGGTVAYDSSGNDQHGTINGSDLPTIISTTANELYSFQNSVGHSRVLIMPSALGWNPSCEIRLNDALEATVVIDLDALRPTTTTTYYVATTGSSGNDGLTATTPKATVDQVLAIATGTPLIYVAPGSYGPITTTPAFAFHLRGNGGVPVFTASGTDVCVFTSSHAVTNCTFNGRYKTTNGTRVFENVIFQNSTEDGLTGLGNGELYLKDCSAITNNDDGFNYEGTVKFFEIGCTGSNNGVGAGPNSNGSSAHNSALGIRVNGTYENNYRNVHDVDNAKTVLINCTVNTSQGAAGQETSMNVGAGLTATNPHAVTIWVYGGDCTGGATVDFYTAASCTINKLLTVNGTNSTGGGTFNSSWGTNPDRLIPRDESDITKDIFGYRLQYSMPV